MSTKLRVLSGTGNRFAMLDAITQPPPRDPGALARALCSRENARGPHLDGLLIVLPGREGGDVRMQLYNADGSAAETCGNGLRCVGKFAFEQGLVRTREFVIEDASGLHATIVGPLQGTVEHATVSMRRPRILARAESIELFDGERTHAVQGTRVDVGNPHFVLVVDDVARAPVTTDGPRIERHAAFPAGTNVAFVARRTDRTDVRVWERGVGETEACGSGACAVAAALVDLELARLPIDLVHPGGVLRICENPDGSFALAGAVEDLGERDWPRAVPMPSAAG
jgi:diaminopimelate epimerase